MNFNPLLVLSLALIGCEDQSKEAEAPKAPACDLNLDSLDNSEWLFLRSEPGKPDAPDLKSRLKFFKEGSDLKAKYTVASLSDMYTYDCATGEEGKLVCKQKPDYQRWCETLMANGRKCTINSFKKLDENITDNEELQKGVAEAQKIYKAQKEGDKFKRYTSRFNSLGNKLQGLLYIRVDENNCNLKVTDNYMTFYNAKRLEDSNPNGINPFVKNEVGELLWEDCESSQLFDTTFAEYPEKPEDIQPIGSHAVGTEVHYWLLHGPLRYAEAGCNYSYDIYHNYKVAEKDKKPVQAEVKGKTELRWQYSKKYDAASSKTQPEIVMMVTKTQCEGKPEKRMTGCNKVVVK